MFKNHAIAIAQDALYDKSAFAMPYEQSIEIALHDIDGSTLESAPDLTDSSRVVTVTEPERAVCIAVGYLDVTDAGRAIGALLQALSPDASINLYFTQGAPVTPSCSRFLRSRDVFVSESPPVDRRWWLPDGVILGGGHEALRAVLAGQATAFSVRVARELLAFTRSHHRDANDS